jgi:hypothetical protein
MHVALGADVVATLLTPPGPPEGYGARIEVPVTRAIASAWREAVLTDVTWTVTLDSPVAAGDYQLVWIDNMGGNEIFIPLFVEA